MLRTESYIALHLEYIYNAKYAIREKFWIYFLINSPYGNINNSATN